MAEQKTYKYICVVRDESHFIITIWMDGWLAKFDLQMARYTVKSQCTIAMCAAIVIAIVRIIMLARFKQTRSL